MSVMWLWIMTKEMNFLEAYRILRGPFSDGQSPCLKMYHLSIAQLLNCPRNAVVCRNSILQIYEWHHNLNWVFFEPFMLAVSVLVDKHSFMECKILSWVIWFTGIKFFLALRNFLVSTYILCFIWLNLYWFQRLFS